METRNSIARPLEGYKGVRPAPVQSKTQTVRIARLPDLVALVVAHGHVVSTSFEGGGCVGV